MVGRLSKFRPVCLLLIAMAGLLCLAAASRATTRSREELACPICGTRFEASIITSTNTFGGIDSDLLERAVGNQAEPYYLASCPTCRYTAYHADFEDLGEQTGIVRQVLAEMDDFTPDLPSDEFPGSKKYTIAMRIYSARGRDPRTIGDLLLRAAWCRRLEGPEILDFSESSRQSYATAMKQLEQLIESQNIELQWNDVLAYKQAITGLRSLTLGMASRNTVNARNFLIVYFFQRLGENIEAMRLLNTIERQNDKKTWATQLAAAMWKGISEEMVFHRQTVLELRKALARNDIPKEDLAITYYLVAENLHRAGREKEAIQWFQRALAQPDLPDWLTPIAEQQLSLSTN